MTVADGGGVIEFGVTCTTLKEGNERAEAQAREFLGDRPHNVTFVVARPGPITAHDHSWRVEYVARLLPIQVSPTKENQ